MLAFSKLGAQVVKEKGLNQTGAKMRFQGQVPPGSCNLPDALANSWKEWMNLNARFNPICGQGLET